MDINISERIKKVMLENGVSSDKDAFYLMLYGGEKFIRLRNFCKRYNCSADYILGLSDRYWGN